MANLKNIVRRNSPTSFRMRKVISDFCDNFGFVYFGNVDQHYDEHEIVRGLTASAAHIDEHYSIGSSNGYDIKMVYRTDSIESPSGTISTHAWLIFEIDLHSSNDLPHIFIGGHDHRASPYTKLFVVHPAMQKILHGTHEAYSEEFTSRYSVYSQASHFVETKELFDDKITRVLAAHFWPLSLEVFQDKLYIYADNKPISTQLLEVMLKNGLWLADQIDSKQD